MPPAIDAPSEGLPTPMNKKTTEPRPPLQIVADDTPHCVHHWVLGDPTSGVILGRCKRCNATKAYPAVPESGQRFDDYRELTSTDAYYSGERRSA
jgi:hypothetical protein